MATPEQIQSLGESVKGLFMPNVPALRLGLDRQKAEAAAGRPAVAEVQRSLLTRIQAFLRLPNLLGD